MNKPSERKPWKGILLYGPPGGGKSLLVEAVATEVGCNFICVNGPELLSPYMGQAEARLREMFIAASRCLGLRAVGRKMTPPPAAPPARSCPRQFLARRVGLLARRVALRVLRQTRSITEYVM